MAHSNWQDCQRPSKVSSWAASRGLSTIMLRARLQVRVAHQKDRSLQSLLSQGLSTMTILYAEPQAGRMHQG